MGVLVVIVPWPDPCLNPNRAKRAEWFHRKKSDARQRQKNNAYLATIAAMRANNVIAGSIPPGRIRVTMHWMQGKNQRALDDDNAIAAMKGARDGIAQALGVDDRRFWIQPIEFKPARNAASCVHVLLEWGHS